MSCVFCAILAGEISARRVDEDEHAVAFLDVSPWQVGHTLVVPRRHVTDVLAEPTALAEIAPLSSRVGRRLVDRLDADGLNLFSSAGAVAGQEVFHLHLHLIPRYAAAPGLPHLIERPSLSDDDVAELHARLTAP